MNFKILRFLVTFVMLNVSFVANAGPTVSNPLTDPSVLSGAGASCPNLEGPLITNLEDGDTLNLYAKPRMNSDILGLLPSNARGVVSGKCKTRLHNQWCQVQWGCVSGYARMVMMAHISMPVAALTYQNHQI